MDIDQQFDWPVGNIATRTGPVVPRDWYVAVGYNQEYWLNGSMQVHPGLDMNLRSGGDSDLGEPVYAAATGVVTASGDYRVWGNIVLVRHALGDGTSLWSQYAHLDQRHVRVGQAIPRGWQLGTVGKGEGGRYSAHLHFEIRARDLAASYWPGSGHEAVRQLYVDPADVIGRAAPAPETPEPTAGTETRLRVWADSAQRVNPNERAALWHAIRTDGFFPISDESDVGPHRAQLARDLGSARERIYFAPIGQWDTVLWIDR